MANINKIKIGAVDPDTIMYDKPHEDMSNLKFDFTEWTQNEAFANDITVEQGRITIRKFKPNTWIVKSPDVTGSQNNAICTYCRGTVMTSHNIDYNSSIFSQEQEMRNIVGAGNDLPKFRGFCPYPMKIDGTYTNWMQIAAYTWDSTWSDKDDIHSSTKTGPGLADWATFRLGTGGHGTYGIWSDFTNRTMFPDTLYDFNTLARNPDNTVTWNYGFMLATGNVNDFDDDSWEVANGATLEGRKVKITTRIAADTNGWHVGKWAAPKACKIKVSGLSERDTVYYGSNSVANNNVVLCTADGTYDIPAQSNGGSWGFGFRVCGIGTSEVTLEFVNELTDDNGLIDISDNPIVLELFNTNGVDITSVECWDTYCGATQVWHKDKTVNNCWMKYRLAFPNNWALHQSAFSTSPYIQWLTATKFKVNYIPQEGVSIEIFSSSNSNYISLNFQGFSIKVYNKPDDISATFSREFLNITTNENASYTLSNGKTDIAKFSKIVYRQDSNSPISYKQAKFTFLSNNISDAGFIVELIPEYEDIISINSVLWQDIYPLLYIPEVVDMEDYMAKIKWNIQPVNTTIWERVKTWYKNNTAPLIPEQFRYSSGLDNIVINTAYNDAYLWANDMFNSSEVQEVTLNVPRSSRISSANAFFRGASLLKTINVNLIDADEDIGWHAAFGCTDCSGWFEYCSSLETYPANLIDWYCKDLNVRSETTGCTRTAFAFEYCSSLKDIPSFDYEAVGLPEEANTIIPTRYAIHMFYECTSLQTIGPILDMKLVTDGSNMFKDVNALTSVRIRNLNHRDWDFTDTLKSLDATSVQYLFENLADLTRCNPETHEDTIDKSFKNWVCYYFGSTSQSPNWDYNMDTVRSFIARKRYATSAEAPFVASTDSILDNMNVTIDGLGEGDSIVFGADGNVEPDYTFTEDGQYDISKSDNTFKGFKVLSSNVSSRNEISLLITNGLDYTNPAVSSANLKCPEEWTDKVTSEMITAANTKGWTIYIGGTEV